MDGIAVWKPCPYGHSISWHPSLEHSKMFYILTSTANKLPGKLNCVIFWLRLFNNFPLVYSPYAICSIFPSPVWLQQWQTATLPFPRAVFLLAASVFSTWKDLIGHYVHSSFLQNDHLMSFPWLQRGTPDYPDSSSDK